ncbi:MAG TPA: hypothetical protein VFC60_00445 [Tissierellaceae bacterium]|nr:hypothetical protein [Tissierellaceae bacterium]
MELTGEVILWANEVENKDGKVTLYSISVGNKNQDGKYDNAYLSVYFSKEAQRELKGHSNGDKIRLQDAWLTVQKTKDGNKPAIFVNRFRLI